MSEETDRSKPALRKARTALEDVVLYTSTFVGIVFLTTFLLVWKYIPVWFTTSPAHSTSLNKTQVKYLLIAMCATFALSIISLSYMWFVRKTEKVLCAIDDACAEVADGQALPLPVPTGPKELRSFVGAMNQFKDFSGAKATRSAEKLRNIEGLLDDLPENASAQDLKNILGNLD